MAVSADGRDVVLRARARDGRLTGVPGAEWADVLRRPAAGEPDWCITFQLWRPAAPGLVPVVWLRPDVTHDTGGHVPKPELDLVEPLGDPALPSTFSHPPGPGRFASDGGYRLVKEWKGSRPARWELWAFRLGESGMAGWNVATGDVALGPVWWPDTGYRPVVTLWGVGADEPDFPWWPAERRLPPGDGEHVMWLREMAVGRC